MLVGAVFDRLDAGCFGFGRGWVEEAETGIMDWAETGANWKGTFGTRFWLVYIFGSVLDFRMELIENVTVVVVGGGEELAGI